MAWLVSVVAALLAASINVDALEADTCLQPPPGNLAVAKLNCFSSIFGNADAKPCQVETPIRGRFIVHIADQAGHQPFGRVWVNIIRLNEVVDVLASQTDFIWLRQLSTRKDRVSDSSSVWLSISSRFNHGIHFLRRVNAKWNHFWVYKCGHCRCVTNISHLNYGIDLYFVVASYNLCYGDIHVYPWPLGCIQCGRIDPVCLDSSIGLSAALSGGISGSNGGTNGSHESRYQNKNLSTNQPKLNVGLVGELGRGISHLPLGAKICFVAVLWGVAVWLIWCGVGGLIDRRYFIGGSYLAGAASLAAASLILMAEADHCQQSEDCQAGYNYSANRMV